MQEFLIIQKPLNTNLIWTALCAYVTDKVGVNAGAWEIDFEILPQEEGCLVNTLKTVHWLKKDVKNALIIALTGEVLNVPFP